MKTIFHSIPALLLALLLFCCAAAETVSFAGTVTASETCPVYAPLRGAVESVLVKPGQRVKAGDVIAVLRANRAFAAEDGVVAAVFGSVGDRASAVAERYGAVVYIEGDIAYTVSCSLSSAYKSAANTCLTPGHMVYLRSVNDYKSTGTGVITRVEKTATLWR